MTHRHVLQAAGIDVDLPVNQAARRVTDPELCWAYLDQRSFCPTLHELIPLRQNVIKRQVLTTVEVLVKPISGRQKTHLVTGYVHKPYPPKYAALGRYAGFDSALLVRGTEGGVIPSLKQQGKVFCYQDFGIEQPHVIDPSELGIVQNVRAVPLPEAVTKSRTDDEVACISDTHSAAVAAAESGLSALKGELGPAYDSLLYACALILWHTGKADDLKSAAGRVRQALDSGSAMRRLR